MPLYDYRCQNCSHELEVLQGINEERLNDCPECKKPELKRLASAPSFTFKGGGWYKDLYGSAGKSGDTDKKPAPATSTPSTKSSDSSATAPASSTSSSTGKDKKAAS